MAKKKTITMFIIFMIIININIKILANNDSDEIIDENEVQNIIKEASATVVYDRKTGKVLYGKKENEKCKMASTTKILTALIVIEKVDNLSTKTKVSAKAAGTGGSRLGLKTDDEISIHDLLYGLLLCSGNDAAVALAEYVSGSVTEFAALMNEKAEELNLKNSHFVTPHGLDEDNHYTTAYELARITDIALENSTFSKIVKTKNYTVHINGNYKNLTNTNELLGNLNRSIWGKNRFYQRSKQMPCCSM